MRIEKRNEFSFYHADCMQVMRETPDKYYDLALVDPPYGIGGDSLHANRKSKNCLHSNRPLTGAGKLKNRALNTMNTKWDIAPSPEYFQELKRVSKNQIIWGGNYFPLPPSRCILCWDKVQPWENFSQIELAWTSFDSPAQIYKYDNRTGDKIHPTQKPVQLYSWILSKYAKQGDKILDTHGGSMSIALAVDKANKLDNMNLSLTVIELDEEYFNAALHRFDNGQLQQTLNF
jgi:site-specific DNA-methyltransferase (adenine-specific)